MPKLTVVKQEINGYAVEVDVVPEAGRLVAQAVRVTNLPGGPAVTGEAIRSVPVAMLTKLAARHLMQFTEHEGYTEWEPGLTLDSATVARLRENGPRTETLEAVTYLYRLALLVGDPPTKVVETVLGVPRSTAGRWVAAARKHGLLGPSEGSGKAGG
jgi:hypothetical protein